MTSISADQQSSQAFIIQPLQPPTSPLHLLPVVEITMFIMLRTLPTFVPRLWYYLSNDYPLTNSIKFG